MEKFFRRLVSDQRQKRDAKYPKSLNFENLEK